LGVEPLNADPAYSYTFEWIAEPDACEECLRLVGTYEGQSIYQNALVHPVYGEIWDFNIDFPLTHGSTGAHCRCRLICHVTVNWTKLNINKLLSQSAKLEEGFNKGENAFAPFWNDLETPENYGVLYEEVKGMSSVTEVRNQIQEIDTRLTETIRKSEKGELSLKQEVKILNVMLMALQETGNKDIDEATRKVRELTMWALRARIALNAVQAAMVPGAGWASALYAGANIAALGMATYDAAVGYQ